MLMHQTDFHATSFARRFWDGVYVLYTYTAKRSTSQGVQKLLSKPAVGGESNILRHMTFVR
jgi:small subunit ribosomal protein S6